MHDSITTLGITCIKGTTEVVLTTKLYRSATSCFPSQLKLSTNMIRIIFICSFLRIKGLDFLGLLFIFGSYEKNSKKGKKLNRKCQEMTKRFFLLYF